MTARAHGIGTLLFTLRVNGLLTVDGARRRGPWCGRSRPRPRKNDVTNRKCDGTPFFSALFVNGFHSMGFHSMCCFFYSSSRRCVLYRRMWEGLWLLGLLFEADRVITAHSGHSCIVSYLVQRDELVGKRARRRFNFHGGHLRRSFLKANGFVREVRSR